MVFSTFSLNVLAWCRFTMRSTDEGVPWATDSTLAEGAASLFFWKQAVFANLNDRKASSRRSGRTFTSSKCGTCPCGGGCGVVGGVVFLFCYTADTTPTRFRTCSGFPTSWCRPLEWPERAKTRQWCRRRSTACTSCWLTSGFAATFTTRRIRNIAS